MHRSRFISLIVIILSFSAALGQTLSIQGVIRDNTGASVADASHSLTFYLYTVETGGGAAWSETQVLEVINGVYSANLGAVNSLAGLNYNVNYWLGISIDGAEELTPRTKLTLSPYAIAAGMNGTTNVFPQDGAVGVGTTAPRSLFSIANINGIQDDWNDQLRFYGINNNQGFGIQSDADGGNFGTTLALNPAGGYVGIGTTAPRGLFSIANINGIQNDPADQLRFYGINNNAGFGIQSDADGGAFGTTLALNANGGYVGIGTQAPIEKLHVEGSVYATGIIGNRGDNIGQQMELGNSEYATLRFDSDKYRFWAGGSGGSGEILTIHENGNMGLGTPNPAGALHIYKPDAARIFLEDPQGANYLVSDGNRLYIGRSTSPAPVNDILVIDNSSGNIGINTANPVGSLHIKQTTGSGFGAFGGIGGTTGLILDNLESNDYWRLVHEQNGNLLFDYSGGNFSYISLNDYLLHGPSDRSLKKNITPFHNVLSKVIALKPVEFHFKQTADTEPKTVGFIAQEVEEVFPNLVGEYNGKKHLAYAQFGVLAIAAIKEQQEIIDHQTQLIQELMDRVNALEKQSNK